MPHATSQASPWIRRFTPLIPAGASVLDVACGQGRHMRWLAEQGHAVLGVDRSAEALQTASQWGDTLQADLEDGSPWPLPGRQFGAVVVTNYLWRSLFPALLASVQPGGVLLYETFAHGNASVGRPSSPDFLLQPGELLQVLHEAGQEWRVVHMESNLRPALPDNMPLIQVTDGLTRINGLFRHGWLIAPALVENALQASGLAASR